jgi:tetratricopeptide (TPR) repeat protein
MTGQQVAITGRLASMSRQAIADLIEREGGQFTPNVTRQTTMLVVGREGWPLRSDGQLTRKLQRARALRQRSRFPDIVPEESFLRQLQLSQVADEVCQSSTVGELTRLLDVPRSRIEAWQRAGLLRPTASRQDGPRFDYRQVAAARSLAKLLETGVSPQRLKRSLWELRSWMPADDDIGGMLSRVLLDGARVLYRTDVGSLIEGHGQLLFDFSEEADAAPLVRLPSIDSTDRLFEEAVQLEQEGRLEDAAQKYRRLLLEEGPDSDVCFNLANVLAALGETQAAIERLHEAVTIDRHNVNAWNNLGNLMAEVGCLKDSRDAYEQVLALEPDYSDARYGLADVLEQLGEFDAAATQWRAYLRQESAGPWADYARQCLATRRA